MLNINLGGPSKKAATLERGILGEYFVLKEIIKIDLGDDEHGRGSDVWVRRYLFITAIYIAPEM